MAVNLFLSTHTWTLPLNAFGVRQHVAALYEEVFRGCDMRVYPKGPTGNLLADVLRHLPVLLAGEVNVLAPDYPVVAGALASWARRYPGLIVHTWKVPGVSDARLSARVYDFLLRRVIDRARAVVVVSMAQKRQLEALGVSCPVVFAPVTVNSQFWHADPVDMDDVLAHFDLEKKGYVLTVGGSDRDEIYAAQTARMLGLPYVRATYSVYYADRARALLARENLISHSRILVKPSDVELRALYAGAWLVCLPTLTRTNPAGLTSLAEGMACGAVVAIPETIAEGYVADGINGLVLRGAADDFAARVLSESDDLPLIRQMARKFAETKLNNLTVAQQVRAQFQSERVWG
ncbi:MAG: glycosyltransferase [Sulfuricella sp.]|nr:glycosyltransferase [Sulfuricella sp.]